MGPIANYDLGSVHGEVRITYDRQGIQDARQDINDYLGDVNRLRDALRQYDQNQNNSSQNTQNFGQSVRDAESGVEALGAGLRSISKIPILLGAAQEVVAFGAAITPVLGLLAVTPAAAGAVGAAFATVKIATSGMGDAMSAVAEGDAEALNEAMAKLAPNAQAVVREYQRLKPALDGIKMDVQQRFWAGFATVAGQLGDTYLPVVGSGLGLIADQMAINSRLSAQALMQPETVSALNTLLVDSAEATGNFGSALGDVLAGFINIAGAGSNWLPLWTHGVSDLTTRFREWTASAEGQAQINTWIQQGANVLGQLVQLIGNLGSIASGVFNAMQLGGGGILQTLVDLTAQAAAWVNSAEGQATLIPIFQLLHDVFVQVVAIATTLAGWIGQIVAWFAGLPEPVRTVVVQFLAWSAVLGVLIGWLTPLISLIAGIITHFGTIVTVLRTVWSAFMLVINVFRTLSLLFLTNPWLLLIAAVIALVAIIIYNWDTIKQYLLTAWNWIQTTAATVWGAIVAFFTTIWDSIKAPVIAVWTFIQTFIQTAWDIILNILRFGAAILLALFFTIWNPLVDIVTTVWNAIVAFITPILQTIGNAISAAWNAIVSVTQSVWNTVVGVITSVWNAIWGVIGPYVQMAWDAIVNAWNAISSVTSSVWNTITGAISSAWNTITGIFSSAVGTVMGVLSNLWNRISSLASSALSILVNAGRNIVTGLWNGIAAMGSWIYNKIMSWVRSVVPGPILSFLGIASPSKWMDKEVGRNLPPGLARGVEHETPVAEDAARLMAEKTAKAAASVKMLPPNLQQRVGALASATGAVTSPSASLANATAPAAVAGATTRTLTIGNLTLQVAGNLDPTDPVRWRKAIENLRTDITTVEASYR